MSRSVRTVLFSLCVVGCSGSEASGPAWSEENTSSDEDTATTMTSAGPPVSTSTSDASDGADTSAGGATSGDDESSSDAGEPGVDCSSVAHVGDSLTANTARALTDAYAGVGITATIDAYGGRAILQKLPEDPHTGEEAAESIRASGFTGCWVVALGTNDTANVAAGAGYTRAEAIDAMMVAIDETAVAPVMWVDTFTTLDSDYWSNDNMVSWNEALVAAVDRWPNLKIDDWSSVAATGVAPYGDGIHHTSEGYDIRNAHIVAALLDFFPLP